MKTVIVTLGILLGAPAVFAATVKEVAVTDEGFQPSEIKLEAGQEMTLRVKRTTDKTCAKKITVPSRKIKLDLPLNQAVDVKLGKLEKGSVKFGCGMGMMVGGVVIAE